MGRTLTPLNVSYLTTVLWPLLNKPDKKEAQAVAPVQHDDALEARGQ